MRYLLPTCSAKCGWCEDFVLSTVFQWYAIKKFGNLLLSCCRSTSQSPNQTTWNFDIAKWKEIEIKKILTTLSINNFTVTL